MPNCFCQGEDVVAGIRTPEDLEVMKSCMPDAYKELEGNCEILEKHYKDMMVNFNHSIYFSAFIVYTICTNRPIGKASEIAIIFQDIEFTVQENRLWMLQCRSGKRTGKGAFKIAVDMVDEGLVDIRSAIKMVEPQHLDQLLHPQVYDLLLYIGKC